MEKNANHSVTFKLTQDLKRQLEALAKKEHRSVGAQVRCACIEQIKKSK